MADNTLPPPILIQQDQQLASLIENELSSVTALAFDTESNSLYAYQEQVCLIQISTPTLDYIVDPLALSNIQLLGSIFENPQIEKVFHAAEYDILCLKRDFHFQITNLFDTRVACRTLGYPRTGLGDLLEELFNVEIDKRYQRANWGKRPLPHHLLSYARLDTHYLLDLRNTLGQELIAKDRQEEAMEECKRLTQLSPAQNGFDPHGFWRISGARDLKPQEAAILQELYLFRDRQARYQDRPPFKILGDKTLKAIAMAAPQTETFLENIPKVSKRQIERYASGILKAVQRGLQRKPPQPPNNRQLGEEIISRFEDLRQWRKKVARARQVESDVILPRETTWDIARQAPRTRQQLKALMTPLEWRFQEYGEEIMAVLWGKPAKR